MDIHVLDWFMYFVFGWIINKILGDEFTTELGGVIGMIVFVIYTVIYVVVFSFYNWIDIWNSINFNFTL